MISEIQRHKLKYRFRVKDKIGVIFTSNDYSSSKSAIRGFKTFSDNIHSGLVVVSTKSRTVSILNKRKTEFLKSKRLNNIKQVETIKEELMNNDIMISNESGSTFNLFLNSIGDIQLKDSIKVIIDINPDGDGDYIAHIDKLKLFAYGSDLDEVIEEIKYDVEDLYDDLFVENIKIGYPMTIAKEFLERLI